MKTIEVTDDLYFEIRKRSISGETDEQALKRMIGFRPVVSDAPRPNGSKGAVSPLTRFLESPQFLVKSNAVGRFKEILSWLYRQDNLKFTTVLKINGSKRQYFGTNIDDLIASGENVMPQSIPGTPYYVITNNDTAKKRSIMADVMRVLGYKQVDITVVCEAIK